MRWGGEDRGPLYHWETRFAWLPTQMTEGDWLWLESYDECLGKWWESEAGVRVLRRPTLSLRKYPKQVSRP